VTSEDELSPTVTETVVAIIIIIRLNVIGLLELSIDHTIVVIIVKDIIVI